MADQYPTLYDTEMLPLHLITAWHDLWTRGAISKKDIEMRYLHDHRSNGKRISSMWRDRLGIETEKVHPLAVRVQELEAEIEDIYQTLRSASNAVPDTSRVGYSPLRNAVYLLLEERAKNG